MGATLYRRSPKHPRTRTLPKSDREALAERIDLILRIKGNMMIAEQRFNVVEAILSISPSVAKESGEP